MIPLILQRNNLIEMIPLEDLGKRICIIGLSSGGKSTLAQALGKKLQLKVCHLDQLAHIPGTNWQPRDKELLRKDHVQFLRENREWIIEGNYSFLMKERFTDATAVIWLDFNVRGAVIRYLLRALKSPASRPGNLLGATRQFSLKLVKYIIFTAPKNREKYRKLITETGVTLLHLTSFKSLKKYYRFWELERRS